MTDEKILFAIKFNQDEERTYFATRAELLHMARGLVTAFDDRKVHQVALKFESVGIAGAAISSVAVMVKRGSVT